MLWLRCARSNPPSTHTQTGGWQVYVVEVRTPTVLLCTKMIRPRSFVLERVAGKCQTGDGGQFNGMVVAMFMRQLGHHCVRSTERELFVPAP